MTSTLHLSQILCLSTDAAKFALQHGAIHKGKVDEKEPIE